LLRKKLAEHDAAGGDPRLILSRTQIVDLVQLFLPSGTDEAKLVDRIDGDINRVVELGFLRRLRGQEDQFEVRRILKAFVDAQGLGEVEQRVAEYRAHLEGGPRDVCVLAPGKTVRDPAVAGASAGFDVLPEAAALCAPHFRSRAASNAG